MTTRALINRGAVVMALLAGTTACAGPSTPINASLREFPQNVRIGDGKVDVPLIAPVPPSAPFIRIPIPGLSTPSVAQPPVISPSGAPPIVEACPKAALGVTPVDPTGIVITRPAAAQLLTYRTSGKHSVGGAMTETVDYPATSTRLVGPPTNTIDATGTVTGFTYDVTATVGTQRTVTTYGVVFQNAGSQTAAGPSVGNNSGLFVNAMKTIDAQNKVIASFTPVPTMLVVPFPADEGATFSVASTDASTGTTVAYSGAVGKHVVVDACGQVIDTREVTHTGTISVGGCGSAACTSGQIGTGNTTSFTATYDLALQYGGLSVHDKTQIDGLGLDAPFKDTLESTVNSVPWVFM